MQAAVRRNKAHVGRPIKEPTDAKAQIMLLVKPKIKAALADRARKAGHSLSREGELWLEELLFYRSMFKRTGQSVEQIDKGAVDAALSRRGFTRLRTPPHDVWFSPGHPHAPKPSGFFKDDEAQR